MGSRTHCLSIAQADLRIRHLRLSTIKKCPHMLRSDHRGLRNRDLKLMWWRVVVVGVVVVGVEGENRDSLALVNRK